MSAWDLLFEHEYGEHPDFYFGRPDSSGVRGKGVDRQPYKRAGNFPYDRTDPDQMYGNPQAYDRGSNVGSALHKPLVPKRVPRKMWKVMGLELEDKEIDEIMGSPTFLRRAGSSDMGSSIPGTMGGWARNPPKAWDGDGDPDFGSMEKGQLERIIAKLQIVKPDMTRESPLMIDPRPPDIEQIPNQEPDYLDDQSDSDLEARLMSMGLLQMAPDQYVIGGGNRLTSRGLYGLMPKESAWDVLSRKG